MANLIRSAKPVDRWTGYDLRAFNIQVVNKNADEFFGHPLPEQLNISHVILNNLDEPSTTSVEESEFFAYLKATIMFCTEDTFAVDFVAAVLRLTGYSSRHHTIYTRKEIPFVMCGENMFARTDVCIMEGGQGEKRFLMLVLEDKEPRCELGYEPGPQLIAGAIAALYWNNFSNRQAGLPTTPEAVIPGILICGNAPIFYKIPVSEALVEAVTTAQYPPTVTTVERLVPPVPNRRTYRENGMKPLENRRIVFQCFQGLKTLVHNVYA